MNRLRVICAIPGQWAELTCQPYHLIPVCWNQSSGSKQWC